MGWTPIVQSTETKRALVLGIGGMDGSHLTDILLEKGYEVRGLFRRSSVNNLKRIQHCLDRVTLYKGDITDAGLLQRVVCDARPCEIYNECDQDNIDHSYCAPVVSTNVTYGGVVNLLEVVRQFDKSIRVFQPVSATMFGDCDECPQNENTRFNPQSPYAVAKTAAYYACRYYRQAHGMFVSTAIFYNHDSPRRGPEYLLQKICRGAVAISMELQESLPMGDVDVPVDIGYARDYMEAAHAIMQLDKPDDFVISSNVVPSSCQWSIRDLIYEAFRQLGIGKETATNLLTHDPKFFRPGVHKPLIGDSSKARETFGYNPKTSMQELITKIVQQARDELAQ